MGACVGILVGNFVGLGDNVNTTDGGTFSSMGGASVEGVYVCMLGSSVGTSVGVSVGTTVGVLVGATVGAVVEVSLGTGEMMVGEGVGALVFLVGATVGLLVLLMGAGVGV